MQAIGVFITQLASKELLMDRIEEASALISAAAHDIDHPGRSSAFLCNSDNPLALLYNDSSVLESHHAATTFRLTLGRCRQMYVQMIRKLRMLALLYSR